MHSIARPPVDDASPQLAWSIASAELYAHTDDCDGCAAIAASAASAACALAPCPTGERLAAAEHAAYHAYFRARLAGSTFDPHPSLRDLIDRFRAASAADPHRATRAIRVASMTTVAWRRDAAYLAPHNSNPETAPLARRSRLLAETGELLGLEYVGVVVEREAP